MKTNDVIDMLLEILGGTKEDLVKELKETIKQKSINPFLSNCGSISEMFYRKRQFEYRKADAKNHTDEYLDEHFTEDELNDMVVDFIKDYDCNINENTQWTDVIDDYIESRGHGNEV